jgi:hypothetical protein
LEHCFGYDKTIRSYIVKWGDRARVIVLSRDGGRTIAEVVDRSLSQFNLLREGSHDLSGRVNSSRRLLLVVQSRGNAGILW